MVNLLNASRLEQLAFVQVDRACLYFSSAQRQDVSVVEHSVSVFCLQSSWVLSVVQ